MVPDQEEAVVLARAEPETGKLVERADDVRVAVRAARAGDARIGFVATMGALHEGHVSLLRAARQEADYLVASIFVNPLQFGPNEDFERYPRDLSGDTRVCREEGVDLIFAPPRDQVYPPGFCTYVEVEGLSRVLEGEYRPGHFRGVATVVLKLLEIVRPDVTYFGQKDYQQLAIVRRMVRDLGLDVDVRMCPIVREPDGLALSSRNQYLTASERERAPAIYRSLQLAEEMVAAGERDANDIRQRMRDVLTGAGLAPDYATLVDPETLDELASVSGTMLAVVAARVGRVRLIDNLLIKAS